MYRWLGVAHLIAAIARKRQIKAGRDGLVTLEDVKVFSSRISFGWTYRCHLRNQAVSACFNHTPIRVVNLSRFDAYAIAVEAFRHTLKRVER